MSLGFRLRIRRMRWFFLKTDRIGILLTVNCEPTRRACALSQQVTVNQSEAPWLPLSVKDKITREGNIVYVGSFSRGDKKVMRARRAVKPSKWAEDHRILTMSVKNGPWRNEVTPYLVGIMDAAAFPSVRDIDICKAPQTGVSEASHNFVGYSIDRDPGPVLYIYPDEKTAQENSKDRILPMITSSARLQSYLTGAQDDTAMLRIGLAHMPIYMAWSRSASRLGNKPIKIAISDEIDKYIDPPRREAKALDLIDKRLITYKKLKKSKHWKISTPTWEIGHIWQALINDAEVVFDYHVRCPFCNELQLMTFKQIKWSRLRSASPGKPQNFAAPGKPENSFLERGGREADGVCESEGSHPEPKTVKSKQLAWYECLHCKAKWSDDDRDRAVRNNSEWRARPADWVSNPEWQQDEAGLELFKYLRKYHPAEIGFHVPSWISYFVSLSDPAAAFIKWIRTKKRNALKDFRNGHEAMPFAEIIAERSEDAILALCDDRPRGIVPADGVVAGLTMAADTQDNGFWYEVRAWGWGLVQESWGIREGFVPTLTALEQIFFDDEYLDADGNQYIIQGRVIDAMGHRTKEIYEWCSQHRRVFPFKGEQKMNHPFAFTKRLHYPNTKIPIPGGVNLLRANVNYYKDDLAGKLETAPADPGAWHLHSKTSRDWAMQMTAEYVNEKGLWECQTSRDNHAWDVSVYNLVVADVLGIKFWKRKGEQGTGTAKKVRRVIFKGIENRE